MATAALPDLEEVYRPTHDERARQLNVAMIRKHSIVDMRDALEADYKGRVEPALAAKGKTPQGWRAIEDVMEREPSFRFYSAMRYNAQEMCFQSVIDPVERSLPAMIDVAKRAAATRPAGGSLRTDPNFAVPRYVNALDVHLAPGGFASEWTADDIAQGAINTLGGKIFGYAVPGRRNDGAVAQSIGQWLKRRYPDLKPRRILDMGTGTGRNLLPYLEVFPEAEGYGIDAGAGLLRYAHARAEHLGTPAHFSQQNAEATDFPDGHFDLIVSSFFFHEVTLKATRTILKECHRLLSPGGIIAHMELPPETMVTDYENFFWNWDTANNNEPTYTQFRAQDPVALCAEAGFPEEGCFTVHVPDYATHGVEHLEAFVRGDAEPHQHGRGAWFAFGARKAG